MGWKLDPGVSNDILRKERLFATRADAMVAVFGTVMDQGEWRRMLSCILDEDAALADPSLLRDALDARIGRPVRPEGLLAAACARITANEVSCDLSRHLGVDPLRLAIMAGVFSRGRVSDGDRAIVLETRWKDGDCRTSIKVRLAPGVTWNAGRFTLKDTAIPRTLIPGLKGRTVDEVVGHAWEGWKSIRVTSAAQGPSGATISTGATDGRRKAALAA